MPAYNAGKFIAEAIDSVLNQTYINWDLYIYNDGSTDNTKDIVQSYVKRYHNKIYLIDCSENRGTVFGLNTLIDAVDGNGEFICWLSADDIYTKDMLENSVEFLEKNQSYDLVFSDYEYMDENSNFLRASIFKRYREELKEHVATQPYDALITEGCCIHGCTVMHRSYCYKRVGKFSAQYKYAHDYDIWLRMAAEFNIGYIDKIHVRGREYKTQISMQGNNEIDAIKVLFDFVGDDDRFQKLYRKAGMKSKNEALYKVISGQLKVYKHREKEYQFLVGILQDTSRAEIKEYWKTSESKELRERLRFIRDDIWIDEDFFDDTSENSYLKILCKISKTDVFLINNQAIRFDRFQGNSLKRFNMGLMRSNDIVYGKVKRQDLEMFLEKRSNDYRYYFLDKHKEELVMATSYFLYKNSDIVKILNLQDVQSTKMDIWWELLGYLKNR